MTKYVIEIEPDVGLKKQLKRLKALHDQVIDVVDLLDQRGDGPFPNVRLALVIETGHPALRALCEAIGGNGHSSTPLTPDPTVMVPSKRTEGGLLPEGVLIGDDPIPEVTPNPSPEVEKTSKGSWEKDKKFLCPECGQMRGSLVKATGICKPCAMKKAAAARRAEAVKAETNPAGETCPRCKRVKKLTKTGYCASCNFQIADREAAVGGVERQVQAMSKPRSSLKLSNLKGRRL